MPFNFNGIGTDYYGECDFRPDGSYVTTEWASLFYLPLFPIRSVRLIRLRKSDVSSVAFSSKGAVIIERLPLHWRQVGNLYGFMVLCVVYVATLSTCPALLGRSWEDIPPKLAAFIWLALLTLPYLLPMFLRLRARQKVAFTRVALLETIHKLRSRQPSE